MVDEQQVRIKRKQQLDENGIGKGEYWETARRMHGTKAKAIDMKKDRKAYFTDLNKED